MKRLAVLLLALAVGAGSLAGQAPSKRRIAVLDFDYATVHQWVYDIFGSDQDIGKGIADMLVTNLVRNGTYSVIERKQLDQVLREQNFQQSGRSDPSSAVQLAKILGVDAIIIGSITQFGRDDKKLGVGGAGVHVGGIGIGGFGKKSAKAVVQIDARIVSTTTAEILGVATGHGESKRSGMTLAGGVAVGGTGAAGVVDMGSSNFANTIIGEATRAAVDSLTGQLVSVAGNIQETKVEVRALVADVSGGEVTINVGTGAGVKVGAEYDVVRPGREIRDPATGRVLRRTTTPVGKLKVTQADEGSATGTLSGGPARVGDCVGTCPANVGSGGGTAPPAVEPMNQPNAAAPPTTGGALPALYSRPITGPFTWGMYSFKGTEHFRYNVQQREGNENKTGSYTFDAKPAGNGRTRLSVAGSLGSDSYSSTVTIGPNEGVPMMQLIGLGPVGLALFNPVWMLLLGGHEWELGNGWQSSSNGQSSSFKVEEKCSQMGVNGLKGVLRENQKVVMDMCVSPNVGLPLSETFNNDDGSMTAMQLVEFRP
ncbi:MAG TPA: CsgG/HfaB family protein [Gemmatimonadales bacterium]|jgi:curli biogenesis system outer membrane secretion channel CsgG